MTVKTFNFLPFKKWNKKQNYCQTIGDYTCAIKAVSWGCNGNSKNTYAAVIANSSNPTNIYIPKIFEGYISCEAQDEETLNRWYEEITLELNEKWKEYILKTYLCS